MPRSKFPHPDDAVLLAAALRPPMDRWERRAQAISFAAYNVLLDKPAGTDPWPYVIGVAHAHDQAYGVWRDGAKSKKLVGALPFTWKQPTVTWITRLGGTRAVTHWKKDHAKS